MKKKELKNLAKKIAKQEIIIQTTDDMDKKAEAEQVIMKLSSQVDKFEDIFELDELVMAYVEELS